MKFAAVVLLSLLGVTFSSPALNSNSLKGKEVKALEDEIKQAILDWFQALDNPVELLDTRFEIPENTLVNGVVLIDQLHIHDLPTIEITAIEFHTLTLTLDLSVSFAALSGHGIFENDVVITSDLVNTTVQDNPSGQIALTQIAIDLTIQLSLGVPIQVKALSVFPRFATVEAQLENVLNDAEVTDRVNDFINTQGAQWVNDNQDRINEVASPIIIDIANYILAKLTL